MTTAADVAYARQHRLTRIGDQAAATAVQLWRARMTADFDTSWLTLAPDLAAVVGAAQAASVAGSSRYVGRAAAAQDVDSDAAAVETASFTGVDASGRDIGGLLYGAVTTAKTAIGSGLGIPGALNSGAGYLAAMVPTVAADAGRSADMTAAVGRRFTHYVRVVQPGACSRCAILAGTRAYGEDVFKRHPRCRCTGMPVEKLDKTPARLFSTPDDYFKTLTEGEQDRIFTKAGADAIRAGADPVAVVTARRGATGIDYSRSVLNPRTLPNSGRRLERTIIGHKDGQPVFGYTTGEGTTRRGQFVKGQVRAGLGAAKRVRLMPETVVGLTDDPELRRILLRDAGYLQYPTDLKTRNALIREDRAAADGFYRSLGIAL